MEQLEIIVKTLGAAVAVLTPFLNGFFSHMTSRTKRLDERYERLQSFFKDGGTERHPMLVEASFAAATGFTKLNAQEIELILRQPRPSEFMSRYLQSGSYVSLDQTSQQVELRGLAKRRPTRRFLIVSGIIAYLVLSFPALSALIFGVPVLAMGGEWKALVELLGVSGLAIAMGAMALMASSRLQMAAALVQRQLLPAADQSVESQPPLLPVALTISSGVDVASRHADAKHIDD